jgi:hypothetical protein
MNRKPVSHNRPAAPVVPFVGQHLWGCIIGKYDALDLVAIQKMVDLLEADPSLGVEGAATIAARGFPGKLSAHVERLRKKYRRLKKVNQLPKAGRAGRLERRAEDIRQYFKSRKADTDEAKLRLVEKEREAEALGLDITRQDLFEYQRELERRKESLETPAMGSMLFAGSWFLEQGITDPEEAVASSLRAVEELELIEKQIEVLRELRMLRGMAGRPA